MESKSACALWPNDACCTAPRTELRNPSCCTTSNPAPPWSVFATIWGTSLRKSPNSNGQYSAFSCSQSGGAYAPKVRECLAGNANAPTNDQEQSRKGQNEAQPHTCLG